MELERSTSRGGLSLRRIFTFALAVLFTAFLWTLSASPATHAADASWNGSAIMYEQNKYITTTDKQTLEDVGLESAAKVYIFVDPNPDDQSFNTTNSPSPPTSDRKIRIIYFDAGIDPSTATEAKYKDLTYVAPGNYTNPSAVKTISFEQIGAEGTTSCDVDTGLGWIICPVTMTLATAMDAIYNILIGFLEVRPVETGQDNALYRSWKFMQAFANVAFVIVFMIIIYSQLTNLGISNYGLKKLIPRLIIAALLVNLSYFISSIAVDISNILGYSLQDIFVTMRNSLVGNEGNGSGWNSLGNWESMAGFVLSGGTAVAAGFVGLATVADLGIGVLWLLLPALLVALMAVLVALVVLAARQAIIIILVILSPLAFVAYLLPNTEKWFGKWRDTFFTMLFIFPAFSVVFGGSQLAATAIIQTADSINLIILGMLVQVAPLFITPLLIKLGGGVLSRIAGLINDPNKGLIDRTRSLVKDRTDDARARRLGTTTAGWQLMKRNAQFRNNRRLDREKWRGAHTGRAEARWAGRERAIAIDQFSRESGDLKSLNETVSETRYNTAKLSPGRLQGLDVDLRNAKGTLEGAQHDVELQYKNLQANFDPQFNIIPAHLAQRAVIARRNAQHSSAITRAIHEAEDMQRQQYAGDLQQSEALRRLAGGINPLGADSALASAINTVREAYGKNISEARAINKHFELSSTERQDHGRGDVVVKTKGSATRTFDISNPFTREAAIEDQMTTGTVAEVEEFIRLSGTPEFADFRATIAETLGKNGGMQAKALHVAGQSIDDIAQGRVSGEAGLDWVTSRAIARGKLSEREIIALDPTSIERFRDVMFDKNGRKSAAATRLSATDRAILDQRIQELSKSVREAMVGDERTGIKDGARPGLLEIARLTNAGFDPNDPTTW